MPEKEKKPRSKYKNERPADPLPPAPLDRIAEPLTAWYRAHARDLPWRRDPTPYRVWISEIMLQQTRVETVKPYFLRFVAEAPDAAALASLSDDRLNKLWEGLGYYSRARSLKTAAGQIVGRHGGEIPRSREDLLSLPGVGPYTAGAIAAFAFGLPEPAVDGNVMRVVSRLVACDRNVLDPAYKRDAEAWLRGVIPPDDASAFGQGLIELGALVCLPSPDRPRCEACPLAPLCRARAAGLTGILPVRYKTQGRRTEKKTVLLLTDGEKYLLRRRPETGLLAGLWEFLTLDGAESEDGVRARFPDALLVEPLGEAKHIFTHRTWEMTGYRVTLPTLGGREGVIASREEIERDFAIPSAFAFYKKRL